MTQEWGSSVIEYIQDSLLAPGNTVSKNDLGDFCLIIGIKRIHSNLSFSSGSCTAITQWRGSLTWIFLRITSRCWPCPFHWRIPQSPVSGDIHFLDEVGASCWNISIKIVFSWSLFFQAALIKFGAQPIFVTMRFFCHWGDSYLFNSSFQRP